MSTANPFQVVNPATGETGERLPFIDEAALAVAIADAQAAQRSWRGISVAERAAVLRRVAQRHRDQLEDLARTAVREMGKPIGQARAEVEFSADIYDYYAGGAEKFLAEDVIDLQSGAGSAVMRKHPLGVILGIMPWNFPYYQVARFAAPSLAAGNAVLLKPAPQCPESALKIHRIFTEAALPDAVFTTIFATEEQIAAAIADPRIAGVSFTGSERAGATVGRLAGGAVKKSVLELGGSDPFLVLDVATLSAAVDAAVEARLDNSGQSCNGAKRIIVLDRHFDEFIEHFVGKLAAVTPGDPMSEETVLGPLSSERAAQNLESQVRRALEAGAKALLPSTRDGAFHTCGVLTDVDESNPIHHEELFGPVAIVYRAADEAQAVRIANDTPFGLGAYVFTDDPAQADRVADALDAGMVYVNGVGLDAVELPFGGTKRSGVGRELGSLGIREFVNYKLVRAASG
ncbi:NAD-dependent succinate-semialdehyde dehydrogenase [Mycolicibacterium porcinum]|uniref:NAD-dependent succinate-semialdehyde dehydrogenase n=1 Tax=Mycolicibacterium porcinum TaxID=39693 RepID=UPI0008495D1A|nr:NAD-dependent succinate-semialdehyde dehydrogenase [Mycolicibacterium porcinum]ODR24706.1 succinate-semialdehyde dehydrogenase [Mycolicibacterium porcinum]